jgi:hypothetical protein
MYVNQTVKKQITTIGDLKNYLFELEAAWTDEDTEYLGSFDSQELHISTEDGIAHGYVEYHGEFGLIMFVKES